MSDLMSPGRSLKKKDHRSLEKLGIIPNKLISRLLCMCHVYSGYRRKHLLVVLTIHKKGVVKRSPLKDTIIKKISWV